MTVKQAAEIVKQEFSKISIEVEDELCSDCPPQGYPTDKNRCLECPRRQS